MARKRTAITKAEIEWDGNTILIGYFRHPRVARDVEAEALDLLARMDRAQTDKTKRKLAAIYADLLDRHSASLDVA